MSQASQRKFLEKLLSTEKGSTPELDRELVHQIRYMAQADYSQLVSRDNRQRARNIALINSLHERVSR